MLKRKKQTKMTVNFKGDIRPENWTDWIWFGTAVGLAVSGVLTILDLSGLIEWAPLVYSWVAP